MPSSVDGVRLAWGMEKLGRAFPASFATAAGPEAAEGTAVLWRELLDQHSWVTEEVFVTGVYELAWRHQGPYLPGPAIALDYFREAERKVRAASEQVEYERRRGAAGALAPPPDQEPGAPRAEPEPADEGPTTPEERERWAREDAFIHRHMPGVLREWEQSSYLDDWGPHPTRPGVWIRTEPEGMARLTESRRRDEALARVPDMTPAQRRARDRRLEAEKARAREFVRGLRPRPAPPGWGRATAGDPEETARGTP